jgi:hypothetical protein
LSGDAAVAAVVWLVMPGANSGRAHARTAGSAGDPRPAPVAAPVAPKNVREVHLVLSPLDAQVFLGEDSLGQMPVSVKVEEGKPRTVTIRRKGYRTRKLTLDGTQTRIVVGLNKLPAAK